MASLIAVVIAAMSIISTHDLRPRLQQVSVEFAKREAIRDPLDLLGRERPRPQASPDAGAEKPPSVAVGRSPSIVVRQSTGETKELLGNADKSLPVMDIDFSLAGPIRLAGAPPALDSKAFKVKKRLYVEGRLVGNIDVVVGSDGQLFLETEEIESIARIERQSDKAQQSRVAGQGLVSFSQLREAGLDLRYSPSDDAIALNP